MGKSYKAALFVFKIICSIINWSAIGGVEAKYLGTSVFDLPTGFINLATVKIYMIRFDLNSLREGFI